MRPSTVKSMGHALCAGLVALIVVVPASAGGFSETESFSSSTLTVSNLIGEVHIEGHGGRDFEVVVEVDGSDASRSNVAIETSSDSLAVEFPDAKHFVYPAMGQSKASFRPGQDGGWLGALFGGGQVKVSGSGSGTEIWADLTIRVPDGGRLRIRQGVGEIVAENVDGNLDLDSHWGKVSVDTVDGDLTVDTGSGRVDIASVRGEVSIDTGSGQVEVSNVQAEDVGIDTGSGRVTLSDVSAAGEVNVDTGSGGISLTDVSGHAFELDTGSGNVIGSGIRAESASIDTGSGKVEFMLVEMGHGDFEIDTGSGGITLGLPMDASARVWASAGSGGVNVDVGGVGDMRKDDDDVSFSVGGGAANVTLDTGGGKIRIQDSH